MSVVIVPLTTAAATSVKVMLLLRAWARMAVNASATLIPARAARAPFACSTRIRLCRAVCSCSDRIVCSLVFR